MTFLFTLHVFTLQVKYRSIRKERQNDSESEALISGDDDLLGGNTSKIMGMQNVQQRTSISMA